MKKIYLNILLICFFSNASAQQWEQLNGPSGGAFDGLECSDSVIVATVTEQGFYFSRDSGNSWQDISYARGVTGGILHENNFWIVISEDSIYYSNDNFQTFHSADYPGWNCQNAYLKNGKVFLSSYLTGNVFTTDTGNTWQNLPFAFNHMAIEDSVWYVSDYHNFKISRDNGITWYNDTIMDVKFLLTDSNEVWAGTDNNLYYSDNYGLTWTIKYTATYLKFLKKYNNKLYLSYYTNLLQSSDNGNTWTMMPQIYPAYDYLNIGVSQGMFFTESPYGIFRSPDAVNWSRKCDGILHQQIDQLAIKDGLLLCKAAGDIRYSADYGNTWNECAFIDSTMSGFKSFEYANGILFGVDWHRGVYFSSDTGRIWTKMPIDNSYFTGDLLFNSPTLILPQLFFSEKIFRTDDMGATWHEFHIGPFSGSGFAIQRIVQSPQALLYSHTEVYRSLDTGLTWTNTGLPPLQYNELIFSGNYFYAVLYGGVYRGDATGSAWTNVFPSCEEMYDESIAAKNNEVFFSCGSAIYYSSNDGNNWALLDSFPHPVAKLFYAPPYLYVGTKDASIWRRSILLTVKEINDRNNEISIVPNPTTSTFTLNCPLSTVNSQLNIYNPLGQIIHQQIIKSPNHQIDLSSQPKGIYILEVGNERRKIVLN